MAYTILSEGYSTRVHAWRTAAVLTSTAVILSLLLAVVTTVGLVAAAWATEQSIYTGLALIAGSIATGMALVFMFALTYLPTYQPERRRDDISVFERLFDNASFTLLGVLDQRATDKRQAVAVMLEALFASADARQMLTRMGLVADDVLVAAREVLPYLTLENLATGALNVQQTLSTAHVEVEHMVAALLLDEGMQRFTRQHDLRQEDVGFVVWWLIDNRRRVQDRAAWWRPENMLDFTGIGMSWTAGFTPLVDRFARIPPGNLWDQLPTGREVQVDQLVTTLARQQQSNVLLVGQPGSGRMGVIRELAQRVHHAKAHPELNGQRVLYVHVGELLAQADSSEGQLAAVSRVLTEMERAGNIIAVLGGLESVLGQRSQGQANLTEVLVPFFSSAGVRVVVVVSAEEYHVRLRHNDELLHFFEVVRVPSASAESTLQLLAQLTSAIESRTGMFMPYVSLRALVQATSGVLQDIPYPERAFDVLEEVMVVAQQQGVRVLTPAMITDLITQKVGVPVGEVQSQEKDKLLRLEDIMHERVVNQHQAIATLSKALIRARTGVRSTGKPIGTFLFLGPTGVGKTETAKTLAHVYFGSEEKMQRLDMSEFQGARAVETLVGSATQPAGRLTAAIADQPFTVLLLDEFEKADATVHQLFLQVFDEGHVTDGRGRKVSFQHTIIIATSNAGAELIRQAVQEGPLPDDFGGQLRDHILRQGIYRPELLNRFDGVVTFTPLSTEHVQQVARLMLGKLNRRLDQEHGVTVQITDQLVEYLMSIGYNAEFGARPMNRAIQNTVEYVVARRILTGEYAPGQELTLHPDELATAAAAG